MDKEEVIFLINEFLNEKGIWFEFEDWLSNQGYNPEDLGFNDE